jgi:hypothetical protein
VSRKQLSYGFAGPGFTIHLVSGHDFSRAANATKKSWALAPEGCQFFLEKKGRYEKSLQCYFDFRSAFIPMPGYDYSGEPEERLNLGGALF